MRLHAAGPRPRRSKLAHVRASAGCQCQWRAAMAAMLLGVLLPPCTAQPQPWGACTAQQPSLDTSSSGGTLPWTQMCNTAYTGGTERPHRKTFASTEYSTLQVAQGECLRRAAKDCVGVFDMNCDGAPAGTKGFLLVLASATQMKADAGSGSANNDCAYRIPTALRPILGPPNTWYGGLAVGVYTDAACTTPSPLVAGGSFKAPFGVCTPLGSPPGANSLDRLQVSAGGQTVTFNQYVNGSCGLACAASQDGAFGYKPPPGAYTCDPAQAGTFRQRKLTVGECTPMAATLPSRDGSSLPHWPADTQTFWKVEHAGETSGLKTTCAAGAARCVGGVGYTYDYPSASFYTSQTKAPTPGPKSDPRLSIPSFVQGGAALTKQFYYAQYYGSTTCTVPLNTDVSWGMDFPVVIGTNHFDDCSSVKTYLDTENAKKAVHEPWGIGWTWGVCKTIVSAGNGVTSSGSVTLGSYVYHCEDPASTWVWVALCAAVAVVILVVVVIVERHQIARLCAKKPKEKKAGGPGPGAGPAAGAPTQP